MFVPALTGLDWISVGLSLLSVKLSSPEQSCCAGGAPPGGLPMPVFSAVAEPHVLKNEMLAIFPKALGEFQQARTWTHLVDGVDPLNEYGVVTVTVLPPEV